MMTTGLKIIGISIRTTNKENKSSHDLGMLWNKFYSENIFDKIPNRISDDIFSVYTDYKSDYTEEFTAIIGILVSTLKTIPEGLDGREFKPDHFHKIMVKGQMPGALINAWIDIWQKDKELNRKYTYDFEVHGTKSQQDEESEVEIYLSIK